MLRLRCYFLRIDCAMVRRFFFLASDEHPPKDHTHPQSEEVAAESAGKIKNDSIVDDRKANVMESKGRLRHVAFTSFDDEGDCIQLEGSHARGLATLAASKAVETIAERRQRQQQKQQQQQNHLSDCCNNIRKCSPSGSCNEFTMGIFDEGNGTRIRWWRRK